MSFYGNRRKVNSCHVEVKTLNCVFQWISHPHTHLSVPEQVEVTKGAMKWCTQTTMEKTRDILSGVVAGQLKVVLSRPKVATLKSHIRHSRQKANAIPPVPLPDALQFASLKMANPFTSGQGTRLLMFWIQKHMDCLASADHWHMGGTFDSVLPQFEQLYTIHAIKNNRNIIRCYAFLTDKREIKYERLLSRVQFIYGKDNSGHYEY